MIGVIGKKAVFRLLESIQTNLMSPKRRTMIRVEIVQTERHVTLVRFNALIAKKCAITQKNVFSQKTSFSLDDLHVGNWS